MANRHLSRSIALQTLFEWDFNNCDNSKIADILKRDIDEFGPGMTDFSFVEKLVEGVVNKKSHLDEIIQKAAPEWPVDRVAVVDRNVLRVGLYELLYADRAEVPAKVAINEAIELAKTFGGENSGKFINGVLGTVYKELGGGTEEEELEAANRKASSKTGEKVILEQLGGAVICAREGSEIYLAMVHDVFGYWTLSKGRIKEGEQVPSGTAIKIKEEIGLDVKIEDELGSNEYTTTDPERGRVKKHVTYFLAEAARNDLKLKETGGLDEAKWFSAVDVLGLKLYDDILPIITKAITILAERKQ
ncbi:MAG: transcription antitermination factor NusB [Candidatus Paceibacterota bacterium]|jgi:N utilization substance protein B